MDVEPFNAVALAKKALSASKEAALLAENPKLHEAEFHDISLTRFIVVFDWIVFLIVLILKPVSLWADIFNFV